MKDLELIPTPPGQHWRAFRLQVLPLLVFTIGSAAAAYIWLTYVSAPSLLGEAEGRRTLVATPQAGVIAELRVSRFQQVAAGEPIAVVRPSDPRIQLSVLQAELDALRIRIEPRFNDERAAVDHDRLRLEWLIQKVDLAATTVRLQHAETELERIDGLFKAKLVSQEAQELARANRDELKAQLTEQTTLIDDVKLRLDRQESTIRELTTADDSARTELKAFESRINEIKARLEPVVLHAPIDGVVSTILRHQGEQVVDGEAIVTVSATRPDRILAYVRQQSGFEPTVGMPIIVRARSSKRDQAEAVIRFIGPQYELITNSLALVQPSGAGDFGLPIEISVPESIRLRLGEQVDLLLVRP